MNPHKLLITAYPNKADRRETLNRLTLYYQEAGHSKATARARNHFDSVCCMVGAK